MLETDSSEVPVLKMDGWRASSYNPVNRIKIVKKVKFRSAKETQSPHASLLKNSSHTELMQVYDSAADNLGLAFLPPLGLAAPSKPHVSFRSRSRTSLPPKSARENPLYFLNKESPPVGSQTARVLRRHGMLPPSSKSSMIRRFYESANRPGLSRSQTFAEGTSGNLNTARSRTAYSNSPNLHASLPAASGSRPAVHSPMPFANDEKGATKDAKKDSSPKLRKNGVAKYFANRTDFFTIQFKDTSAEGEARTELDPDSELRSDYYSLTRVSMKQQQNSSTFCNPDFKVMLTGEQKKLHRRAEEEEAA